MLWTTGSAYVSYFLGLITSVLIARSLGADDYGQYAYVVWLSGLLVMVANNGLTMTGIKFIAESIGKKQEPQARYVHAWLLSKQRVSLLIVAVAYLLISPWMIPTGWNGWTFALAGVVVASFVFKAQSLLNTSVAKGFGLFLVEPITNIYATLFATISVIVLALLHAKLSAYIVVFSLTGIAYFIASRRGLNKERIEPSLESSSPELNDRMKNYLIWAAVFAIVGAIGGRSIEMFLLNRWVGSADVGFFAIAAALSRAGIDLLAAGLSSVMMPMMGYVMGGGDATRSQRFFDDACRYYQFMGLLIAGVGLLWADVVVELMYGPQYGSVAPIFRVMIATAGLLLANGAFSAVILNSDNQRFRVEVMILSIVITGVAAFLLIPVYGALGAALAQAISALLSATVIVRGIRRHIGLRLAMGALSKQYVLAAAIGAPLGLVAMLGDSRLIQWGAGVAYACLFVAMSLVAGIWRDDERRMLAGVLAKRRWLQGLARWIDRPASVASMDNE